MQRTIIHKHVNEATALYLLLCICFVQIVPILELLSTFFNEES